MMSISTADVKGPSLEMPSPATDTPALEAGMLNEKNTSPNVVNWDGDNDQLNPQNWKHSKKWLNVLVIALMTISTYKSSLALLRNLIADMSQSPRINHVRTRRPTSDERIPLQKHHPFHHRHLHLRPRIRSWSSHHRTPLRDLRPSTNLHPLQSLIHHLHYRLRGQF